MAEEKNMIIAILLSFIGIGNIYNGLYKRGALEFIIEVIFIILANTLSIFYYMVAAIWLFFIIFDTYLCTKAINNNENTKVIRTNKHLLIPISLKKNGKTLQTIKQYKQ